MWVPIAVGLLFVAGMAHRPILAWWRNSQAERLSESAEAALARGDFGAAGRALQSALRLGPKNPSTLRLAARFCTKAGLPEAMFYWEQLFAVADASDDDRRGYIQAAQMLGRLDRSGPLIQALISTNPQARENQWLLMDQLILVGNVEGAVSVARMGLKEAPDDPERQLTLARVLLSAGTPGPTAEAAAILKSVARGGALQRQALRILVELEGMDRSDEEWVLRSLESLPDPTLSERLNRLDLRIRLEPEHADGRIVEAVDREVRAGLEAGEREELVLWLRQRRRFEAAESLLPRELVMTNRNLAVARLELLGEMRRWDDLERLATIGLETLDPDAADCAAALAAMGRGDREGAARKLDAAASRNRGRPEVLARLAGFAESIGQEETAILIWLATLNRSGLEPLAAPQLLRLVRTRASKGLGSPNEAVRIERAVYDSLIRILGKEPVVVAQWCYLNALLGENLEEIRKRMEELRIQQPGNRAFQAIRALIELERQQVDAALQVMEADAPDWSREEPRWRAVYAAVLRANRFQDRARRTVQGISASQLRPLEAQLAGIEADLPAR